MAKRQKKGLLTTLTVKDNIDSREAILQELKEEKTKEEVSVSKSIKQIKKKPVRVSVDFPRDLYTIMKEDTAERGQTLKGFIVSMIRSHYNNR